MSLALANGHGAPAPAEIPRPPRLAGFLLAAALLHGAGLAALAPWIWDGTGGEPRSVAPTVAGASAEIDALVDLWNTPPETGEAAAMAAPAEAAPAPDTAAAAAAEAGVDAGDASDLGAVSGPGKAPRRPIFAKPIITRTAPPPKLVLRAPEPIGLAAPGLSAPAAPGSGLAGLADPAPGGLGAPGGAMAGLAAPGFALPARPEEESFAPESTPLPRARPSPEALAAAAAAAAEDEHGEEDGALDGEPDGGEAAADDAGADTAADLPGRPALSPPAAPLPGLPQAPLPEN